METGIKFKTVGEYFSVFPAKTQDILKQVRQTIKQAAPQAAELISYNMQAFKLNGVLVYYAAYENHIGFYPTASGIETFKKELAGFKWSKGAVQFPIDKAMPLDLISKITQFRVQEDIAKSKKAKR